MYAQNMKIQSTTLGLVRGSWAVAQLEPFKLAWYHHRIEEIRFHLFCGNVPAARRAVGMVILAGSLVHDFTYTILLL